MLSVRQGTWKTILDRYYKILPQVTNVNRDFRVFFQKLYVHTHIYVSTHIHVCSHIF